MSDLVERMARASYEAGAAQWKTLRLSAWTDVDLESKQFLINNARAAMAIVLEEAAKVAEGLYQQGQIGGDIAAAIRKLGEE